MKKMNGVGQHQLQWEAQSTLVQHINKSHTFTVEGKATMVMLRLFEYIVKYGTVWIDHACCLVEPSMK